MYQLYESTIHQLLVQNLPREQCDLVAVQLAHVLSRQFATDGIVNGLGKHTDKGIHTFHGCLLQIRILYNHLFHNSNL